MVDKHTHSDEDLKKFIHDTMNPVHVAKGQAQLLQMELQRDGLADEKITARVEKIIQAMSRIETKFAELTQSIEDVIDTEEEHDNQHPFRGSA